MDERLSGTTQFAPKDHGSNRRGIFSVPSMETVGYRISHEEREKLIAYKQTYNETPDPTLDQLEGLEQRGLGNQELPAFKHKGEIIEALEQYRAIILGGETGSGKSTQVPQFLLEAGYDKIFVLVPRRVIADGLGERLREELSNQLGETAENIVGIQHGERVDIHDSNRIVVMTPDTYNGMALDLEREFKDQKVAIISDEIHEANLFTEIATGVAAMAVRDNKNWRLIASSATHNAEVLTGPFSKINEDGEVPVVTIEGRPFEVELREESEKNPMEVYASFDDEPLKTMIFTSGKKEIDYIIDKTIEELEAKKSGASSKVIFRKLHGELTEFELSHIDDPIPEDYRLVIVSSPAGMSGITIPGVTRVITDGTINRSELDDDGVSGLIRKYLSKAGVTQQIGRAGRDVAGGIGYLAKPITIEEDRLREKNKEIENPHMPFLPFAERYEHEPAEIYHSNLGRVVLRVAALGRRFGDINEFIPHRVAQSSIIDAEESLYRLGALDRDFGVTKVGKKMNKFPVSPEISRGIVEAQLKGRTVQHLAHVALTAAAIDAGGIQDFSGNERRWKEFVRPTTSDDFMAQLDLMMAVNNAEKTYGQDNERYFFYDHDLHPKKIERARKVAKKILQVMKINSDNLVLTHPLPGEEALLRSDFTAGMIDFVYGESHRDRTKIYYKNIHGGMGDEVTERFISGRSIARPSQGSIIAGIPRWYEKRNRTGIPQRYDVVEQVLSVDPDDVGRYAAENGLLHGKPLAPRLERGVAVEQEQRMFGSIPIGAPVAKSYEEHISTAAQELLVNHALNNPGEKQRALREIAKELETYRERTPADELQRYRMSGAPEDITDDSIKKLLERLATTTRSLSELDRKVGEHIYSVGESISRYFDTHARVVLKQRSPDEFEIGGEMSNLQYVNGQPYVAQLSREQRRAVQAPVFLPDGREVLLQVVRGTKKTRVSLGAGTTQA